MRLIDRIIKKFEEEAIEFASVGMEEEAKASRKLASKYTEMKYNGHSIRSELEEDERRSKL